MTVYGERTNSDLLREQVKATKKLNETLKDPNRTLLQVLGQLKVS